MLALDDAPGVRGLPIRGPDPIICTMDPAETHCARGLRQARSGDHDALRQFIAEHHDRVRQLVHQQLERDFRRSHRWILPLFSTGDIVQDVFLSVVKSQDLDLPSDADDDGLLRYLATVVHHRLIDAVRHHETARRDRRRHLAGGETHDHAAMKSSAEPSVSWMASIGEEVAHYRAVLDGLPERTRLLLDLRLSDECTFEELAQRLSFPSADAARKAFRKAQATLLVRLQDADREQR